MFAVAFDLGRAAKQVLTLGQMIMGKTYQDRHAALVILEVELIELDIVSMKPSSRTRIEVKKRTAILGKLITNPTLIEGWVHGSRPAINSISIGSA